MIDIYDAFAWKDAGRMMIGLGSGKCLIDGMDLEIDRRMPRGSVDQHDWLSWHLDAAQELQDIGSTTLERL